MVENCSEKHSGYARILVRKEGELKEILDIDAQISRGQDWVWDMVDEFHAEPTVYNFFESYRPDGIYEIRGHVISEYWKTWTDSGYEYDAGWGLDNLKFKYLSA